MEKFKAIDEAKQRKREKIGVVVFIFSILFIFAGVISYMVIGHGFDLTASGIDVSVGQLNGYCVVSFEGNNTNKTSDDSLNDKILKSSGNIFNFIKTNTNEAEHDKNSDNNEISLQDHSLSDNTENQNNDELYEKATVDNVLDIYSKKDATVCKIKCCDYNAYPHGEIFEKGLWKIGVLSINQDELTETLESKKDQIIKEEIEANGPQVEKLTTNNTKNQDENNTKESFTSKRVKQKTLQMKIIQDKINNLRNENLADIIIIISPHQNVLDIVEGVDCVICKEVLDELPYEGRVINSVFVMPVPQYNYIGAILSSPAKMLSAQIYNKVEKLE